MTGALATETLRDASALGALESAWWALWRRATDPTPFQSPAWLIPWWDAFAPGELCVVTVRHRETLVGLAPFYIEAGERGRRVMPLGIAVSDYFDILLDGALGEPVTAQLVRHLEREDWQSCEMTELSPRAAAWRIPCPAACREGTGGASTCTRLALPSSVDGLTAALPGGKKRKIRLARNRAARHGGFDILRAGSDTVQPLLSHLVRLHTLRWETRGEPGVLADSRVMTFHRAAAPRLLSAGLLRLYALRIAGRIAGIFYGFHHAGRAYAYLTGFDPAFAAVSPGTLLLAHAIEEAVRDGARDMDFLRGEEAYKQGWGVVTHRNGRRVFHRVFDHADA